MKTPLALMDPLTVNVAIARRVLKTVDAGLSNGKGNPIPGQMCVEAAVCYAYGLPHGDNPPCVHPAVREFKIRLNDANWSSEAARAKGLRQIAIAQLGSATIDGQKFAERLAKLTIKKIVPVALRAAAAMKENAGHRKAMLKAALRCEKEGTKAAVDAAYAAYAANAAYAAYAANAAANAANAAANAANAADAAARATARDEILSLSAKLGVQVLKSLKSPGCKYLYLTKKKPATPKRKSV